MEKFNELIEEFDSLRHSFRDVLRTQEVSKETLLEFQARFNDIKADLRSFHARVHREWTKRDDKAATAIKYRLANTISKGGHPDFDSCSINQAEKYAPSSKEYKEFIEQRAFWKESLVNVNDLRDDISSYLIEIATRIR